MANLATQAVLGISGLGLQWDITCHKRSCLELCKIHASVLPGTIRGCACTHRGEGNGHRRCQEPQIFGFQCNDWFDGSFTYFSKVIWILCSQNVKTKYSFHMVESRSWLSCVKESVSICHREVNVYTRNSAWIFIKILFLYTKAFSKFSFKGI